MKVCSKCKEEKPLDEFSKDISRKDGKIPSCKDCGAAWRKIHRVRLNEAAKQWRRDNRDRAIETGRRWREANREYSNTYHKKRRASDPAYKILHNMRTRMSHALDGNLKHSTSVELLGCTPDQWKAHLESQFVDGMGWNQRGKWVIDHILPCSAFDLTKKKHQKYCFHWSNTQPLSAEANLRKSDKYCPKELEDYLKSELPEPL